MPDDDNRLLTKDELTEAIVAALRAGLADSPIDPEDVAEVQVAVQLRMRPGVEPVTIRITAPTESVPADQAGIVEVPPSGS